jgi:hypothetical protein
MRIACFIEKIHIEYLKVASVRRKHVLKATISLMIKKALSGLSQLSSGPGWRIRDIIHLKGFGVVIRLAKGPVTTGWTSSSLPPGLELGTVGS